RAALKGRHSAARAQRILKIWDDTSALRHQNARRTPQRTPASREGSMTKHPARVQRARSPSLIGLTLAAAAAVALAGCTVMLAEPSRPSPADIARGLTYTEAVQYL